LPAQKQRAGSLWCALFWLIGLTSSLSKTDSIDGTKSNPELLAYGREFFWFVVKQARSCLFAASFFVAMFLLPKAGLFGVARYDLLLLFALCMQ
jgi:hypothetical protein